MADVFDPQAAQMSVASAKSKLADFITDLNARTNVRLQLYQNNVAPSPTNTLAAFILANFGGYADATIASWSAVNVDTNNNAYASSALITFQANGNAPANTIYGSILVGTPSGALQASATNSGNGTGYSPIFTIVAGGLGYTAPPPISLTGATGAGAAAHSVLNANGSLNEIILDSAGSGYTTYTVVIGPPLELIKQNVLANAGISMSLSTDAIQTYTQLIEPAVAA